MKYQLLGIIWFLSVPLLFSQSLTLFVVDEERTPLVAASVELKGLSLLFADYAYTDENGRAVIKSAPNGTYLLTIAYVGYEAIIDTLLLQDANRQIKIQMNSGALELEGVTISARRNMFRQEGDKTILDPEPLAAMSSNTLEMLEMTPGLFVDQDGTIFMGNATPAVIYINGREQRLSNQDIANILRSLPPGSIQRVELLRNPSSKYDAASSGGIINIVLKKGIKLGRFGSVNMGFNQGRAGNRFGGLSLYETNDGQSLYLNANFSQDAVWTDLTAFRRAEAPFLLFQDNETFSRQNNLFISGGGNKNIGKKWNLSYDGRFSGNIRTQQSLLKNDIKTLTEVPLSQVENEVNNRTPFLSHQHDFGATWKPDSLGTELDIKFTYGYSQSDLLQDYTNTFIFPLLDPLFGEGEIISARHSILFQVDYTHKIFWNINWESGIKTTWQRFNSDADFVSIVDGVQRPDTDRINVYQFREQINAAYTQISKDLPFGVLLKTGIRMEQTLMDGQQLQPQDTSFNVQRIDLFPYLFISRKVMSIAGYELRAFLIYRKTLARPSYQNLNPGVRILDQFNFEAGNPALLPQFTNNLEANISFDNFPLFAIGQNRTDGIITQVLYNDPVNIERTFNTFDNIGTSRESYLRGVAGIPPSFRFFAAVGAEYNYLEYQGFYDGDPISFQRGSWRFFMFASMKFTKTTRLMLSGFYMVNGQQNLLELGNFGQVNLNFQQKLFKDKLQVNIFARDVFRTMVTPFRLQQGNILFEGERYADNQRYGCNLRYNFGVKSKEDRKGGLFPSMDI